MGVLSSITADNKDFKAAKEWENKKRKFDESKQAALWPGRQQKKEEWEKRQKETATNDAGIN